MVFLVGCSVERQTVWKELLSFGSGRLRRRIVLCESVVVVYLGAFSGPEAILCHGNAFASGYSAKYASSSSLLRGYHSS